MHEYDKSLSCCLDALIRYLTGLGAAIEIASQLEVNGRIFYDRKLILVNEPSALHALTTIAHEGGHYLHWLRNPELERNRSVIFRERLAYLLGWHLLVKVEAVKHQIVNKQMWRENGIDPMYLYHAEMDANSEL